MERVVQQPKLVDKETIKDMRFPKEEVLLIPSSSQKRRSDLEYAMELGNSAYYKVKIHFEDAEGPKKVVTTVWGLTEQAVVLKHGIRIPIQRISEVHMG